MPQMCGLCGIRPKFTQCVFCQRAVCDCPSCFVKKCERCYDDRIETDIRQEVEEVLRADAHRRRPPGVDKQTQSQTTYTSLRGASTARFTLSSPQFGVYTATGERLLGVGHMHRVPTGFSESSSSTA